MVRVSSCALICRAILENSTSRDSICRSTAFCCAIESFGLDGMRGYFFFFGLIIT